MSEPSVLEIVELLTAAEKHRACEHYSHGKNDPDPQAGPHADGNEQFVRVRSFPCGHDQSPDAVLVLCGIWLEWAVQRDDPCLTCRQRYPLRSILDILGPANGK